MERELTGFKSLDELADLLREDKSVIGLWERFQRLEKGTRRVIVVEREGNIQELLTLSPELNIESTLGNIVVRRIDRGHPIRQIIFIPHDLGEEIILQSGEF